MDPAWDEAALEGGKPRATRKKKSRMVSELRTEQGLGERGFSAGRPLTASALFARRVVFPPQSLLRSYLAGENRGQGGNARSASDTQARALSFSSSALPCHVRHSVNNVVTRRGPPVLHPGQGQQCLAATANAGGRRSLRYYGAFTGPYSTAATPAGFTCRPKRLLR